MPTAIGIGISPMFNEVVSDAGASFVGAYDAIPNLVHLYEPARCGLTSYYGNDLIQLRKLSDSSILNFGHVENGDLDVTTIADWIGGSNGFYRRVFDQLGDGLSGPLQSTPSNQPLYVANLLNGKPGMRHDGNDVLITAFPVALSQPFTLYVVAKMESPTVNDNTANYITSGDDLTNAMVLGQNSAPSPDQWAYYAGTFVNAGVSDGNPNLWVATFNGASSNLWLNGINVASGNPGTQNPDGISIGGLHTLANGWPGNILMVAIADPAHSDAERIAMQDAINDYWAVF